MPLSACASVCFCLCLCLSACLPVCLSACLPVCLSACASACLPVPLSVCLCLSLPLPLPLPLPVPMLVTVHSCVFGPTANEYPKVSASEVYMATCMPHAQTIPACGKMCHVRNKTYDCPAALLGSRLALHLQGLLRDLLGEEVGGRWPTALLGLGQHSSSSLHIMPAGLHQGLLVLPLDMLSLDLEGV